MPSAVLTNPSGRGAPGTPANLGLSHHALASAWRQEAVPPSLRFGRCGSGFHRDRALQLAQNPAVRLVGTFQSRAAFPCGLNPSAKGSALYSATGHTQNCLLPGRVIVRLASVVWQAA